MYLSINGAHDCMCLSTNGTNEYMYLRTNGSPDYMNSRAFENYLAISRSSSASKSVEIFWPEIYWGRLF